MQAIGKKSGEFSTSLFDRFDKPRVPRNIWKRSFGCLTTVFSWLYTIVSAVPRNRTLKIRYRHDCRVPQLKTKLIPIRD